MMYWKKSLLALIGILDRKWTNQKYVYLKIAIYTDLKIILLDYLLSVNLSEFWSK